MAYRLKNGRPLAKKVRRIAGRQLAVAIQQIRGHRTNTRREAIHVARRQAKKIRALLRLVRPVLKRAGAAAERRLRGVKQMFALITDGRAINATPRDAVSRLEDNVPSPAGTAAPARAHEMGRQIHEENPRRFVRRVKGLWQARKRRTAHALPEVASWRPAA